MKKKIEITQQSYAILIITLYGSIEETYFLSF